MPSVQSVDYDPFAQPTGAAQQPVPPPPSTTSVDYNPYQEPPIALGPGERVLSLSEPKKPAPNIGESLARGAYQGATFDFGDRISALEAASGLPEAPAALGPINTLYNAGRLGGGIGRRIAETLAPHIFGQGGMEAYNKKFAEERAANEAARAENPTAYTIGSLAGSAATIPFAPQLAPFKIAETAPLVSRAAGTIGNLVTGGAGYGAVAGAGAAPDVSQMPAGAAEGAAVGAVLGPAVGLPLAGVAKVGGMIGQDIAARSNPQKVADEMVARGLRADTAGDAVAGAEAARARMQAAQAQPVPQPLTMADVAGPKTRSLAGVIERSPDEAGSKTRTFLEQRHLGEDPFNPAALDSTPGRIGSELTRVLGDSPVRQVSEKLIAGRRAAAKTLHDKAHLVPVDYNSNSGQQLMDLLENRIPSAAKGHANALLSMEGKGGKQVIWKQNDKGEFELTAVPNFRNWDYIQQGLQQYIKEDAGGRYTPKGRAAIELRKEINDLLKENHPAYRAAKEKYAGDSSMIDALEAGRDVLKKEGNEVAHEIANLGTAGEKEMYRTGASEAYRQKLKEAPRNADMVKQIFNNSDDVERLRAIAPDKTSYEAMRRFLAQENEMFKTGVHAIGNSATAGRAADDIAAGAKLAEGLKMGMQVVHGYFWGFAHTVFQNLARVHPERRAAVMEAARNVVLNPNPRAATEFIDRLNKGATSKANRDFILSLVLKGLPRGAVVNTLGQRPGQ
jgi:hypothetical protein